MGSVHRHAYRLLFLAVPCMAIAVPMAAAADVSAEERAFLERLAFARARSDVLEQVYALKLSPRLTVGDWAARDLDRDRSLRLWVRSLPRHSAARLYTDATADALVRLEPGTLRDQLERLRGEASESLSLRDLRRAAADWPVVWGEGTASLDDKPRTRKPEGWEDVTFEGMELVRRAAEADARQALLVALGELQVTRARLLREFLDSSAAVRAAVLAALRREATVKVSFAPDQVAVAEARIGMLDLIRLLTDVHREHYTGDALHAADFRGMALLAGTDEVTATGLAIPPSNAVLRPRYAPIELDVPAWTNATLTAAGRYEPEDDDGLTPTAEVEAARLDGIDHLRQKLLTLVLQRDVTVAEFLARHDELKDDVIIFLSGARLVGEPERLADEVVSVSVELPLRRLWWILRRGMEQREVDPPARTTTQPAAKSTP